MVAGHTTHRIWRTGMRRIGSLDSSFYLASADTTLELQSAILSHSVAVADTRLGDLLMARSEIYFHLVMTQSQQNRRLGTGPLLKLIGCRWEKYRKPH